MDRLKVPVLFSLLVCVAAAQEVRIRQAPVAIMPGQVDSNSPGFWSNGELRLFNSTGGGPAISHGPDQFSLGGTRLVVRSMREDWPTWIESVWAEPDGAALLAWYHQEDFSVCGGRLSNPRIGALVSFDNGETFEDLGLVLTSPERPDCSSQNGYFAGGHGDFSVVLDREQKYFYFYFGNYAGPLDSQGVAVARLAFEDRYNPVGRVWKYRSGQWTEPGIGGRPTPVFPATVSWQQADTDSFWGPSIHWNTYLERYVMLLNRSCCDAGWPQEGIYVSFATGLDNPAGWSQPARILDGLAWYPQVLGLEPGETDSVAGQKARLYMMGESSFEIEFYPEGVVPPEEVTPPEEVMPPEEP